MIEAMSSTKTDGYRVQLGRNLAKAENKNEDIETRECHFSASFLFLIFVERRDSDREPTKRRIVACI